ncbi:hypothetical protein N7532_003614 [Penicillium argentinense]|uniref:Uncharacterized protein n=1 Tax=Penicillium argentinense TaxID=1131581 RepID=A0A9W9FNC4_9EURO|nr:uncharacterized protein N7532_003614 [Penicillium argentinense]KAJ5103085.1 hypothetical protein N7532_003614 [Penicillium argentinense]
MKPLTSGMGTPRSGSLTRSSSTWTTPASVNTTFKSPGHYSGRTTAPQMAIPSPSCECKRIILTKESILAQQSIANTNYYSLYGGWKHPVRDCQRVRMEAPTDRLKECMEKEGKEPLKDKIHLLILFTGRYEQYPPRWHDESPEDYEVRKKTARPMQMMNNINSLLTILDNCSNSNVV